MKKLDMKTPNIIEEKQELLKKYFPNIITEAKNEEGETTYSIDSSLLEQEINMKVVGEGEERYRLDWPGKKRSILKANSPITKTLRPVREDSKDFDNTENLYIEGDNFEVLKVLQESYLNKVKMIYIDPPYNTGKDFIYPDDFKKSKEEYEEEIGVENQEGIKLFRNTDTNGRFHSDWLSMMYERLVIARDLLRNDGVIFISIDDNEVHNLRKICDEIFGEENFISLLSIENNPKGRKNSDYISISNDYCLIYGKFKSEGSFVENIPKPIKDMSLDENGQYVHNSGKRVLVGENTFNKIVTNVNSGKHYSVYINIDTNQLRIEKGDKVENENQELLAAGYKRYVSKRENNFIENTYTIEKFTKLFEEGALEIQDEKIFEKNFNSWIRLKSIVENKKYKALIDGEESIYDLDLKTSSGSHILREIFNTDKDFFSSPKSIGLLKLILTLFEENEYIVLDFFSGSATTAHAVMQLNVEDEGNRKYIMVQFPEDLDDLEKRINTEEKKTIKNAIKFLDSINKPHLITEIGKERIRRAGEKIKKEELEKLEKKLKDINNKSEQKQLVGDDNIQEKKKELEKKIQHIKNLDIGFRVYKTDSTNMKDVYYHPSELNQLTLGEQVSNIKEDRTPEDLLTQVMIDLGLTLDLPIEKKEIKGKAVYVVDKDALIGCFDDNINIEIINEITEIKPLKVVFKDSSFKDDKDRINVETKFKELSPDTEITVI